MQTLKLEDTTPSTELEASPKPQTKTFLKDLCRILGHVDPFVFKFNQQLNQWEWSCPRCEEVVYVIPITEQQPQKQQSNNPWDKYYGGGYQDLRQYEWNYTTTDGTWYTYNATVSDNSALAGYISTTTNGGCYNTSIGSQFYSI